MRLGKPENHETSQFTKRDVDGIEVYCHDSVERLADTKHIDIDIEGQSLITRLVMRRLPKESTLYPI